MNFWSLNKTERLRRLDSYTKFMVTRDPFERLLSAFRNKIETFRENDFFGDVSNKIHRIYNRTSEQSSSTPATFEEFLRHVIDKDPTFPPIPKNEHWENYWSICYPCDIDYDYILKLETIEEDSAWLFKSLGLETISYPTGNSKPSNHDLLEQYLKSVDKHLPKSVYKHLQMDYEIFGYDIPRFIRDLF
ncbi:Oidioi.mRNA.OKI2018_I69.PAR.g8551.t1.cds [Oikopleura dioica]|uniref:Carbohydrate sulfotransferase n=1 Tax=Oikopleura dioica TaxID=34765 RepID=A0ABN7RK16_OIKDI|nr:Oidioi.mRNA.OKI2018_I69.PAR.g8551.t1.cds [Oikopleura dioica]